MSDVFVPGAWWNADRARDGEARMTAAYEAPEMRMLMDTIARAMMTGEDPGKTAATLIGGDATAPGAPAQAGPTLQGPVDPAACLLRRARQDDVPRFAELLLAADLPPLFIEEWLGGFVGIEHDGRIIGCGGVEMYDDCAVIRSVAVDEHARGIGLGSRASELLLEDARLAGATDFYLFTMHAAGFWRKLGFVEVPVEAWKKPARASWQYRFFEDHPGSQGPVVSMWRGAGAATAENRQQTTEGGGERH